MGKVHSSIIVLRVWDIEGSSPFLQLPNWQEIKGRSEQNKIKNPTPPVFCQTISQSMEQ